MARLKSKSHGVGDLSRYTTTAAPAPGSPFGQNTDDDRMSGAAFGFFAFVAFVALVVAAVYFGTGNIEADLEQRAHAALNAFGYPDVSVEASGTELRVSGSITTEQSEDDVMTLLSQVGGVTGVEGKVWPVFTGDIEEIVVTGDALDITWSASSAQMSGSLSTGEKLDFVVATLSDSFSRGVDVGGLQIVEGLDDETAWLGATLAVVKRAAELLDSGRIILDPNTRILTIAGETEERAVRDELNALAVETASAFGFDTNPAVRYLEPKPTKADVEDLQVELNDVISGKVVEFEVKSFELTSDGRALLDDIAAALEASPQIRVLVSGHTDSQGADAENQILSEERAQAVVDYLVAKGISVDRFDTIGYGETQPIADNGTADGRARNRRIEFTALLEE